MIMIWSCVLTPCLRFYSLRTLWRGSRGSSPDSRRSGTGVQEENGKIKNILTPDTWGRALSRPRGSTACWRKEEMQRQSYSTRRNRFSLQEKETDRNVLATFRWPRAKQSWESSRICTTGRRFTQLELVFGGVVLVVVVVVVIVVVVGLVVFVLFLFFVFVVIVPPSLGTCSCWCCYQSTWICWCINVNKLTKYCCLWFLNPASSEMDFCSVRNDRAQLTRAVTESHDEVALIKLSRTETIFPP